MARLFLDTNQWNYLVAHPDHDERFLHSLRGRLKQAVYDGALEVVGSLPLLQEITGAHRKSPAKYDAMCSALFDAVRHRWLKPLDQRHVAEARVGGQLAETSRYLSRDTRRGLRALASNPDDIEWAADRTREEVVRFKQDQDRVKPLILAELDEHGGDVRRTILDWYATVNVDDWVGDVLLEGTRRNLVSSGVAATRGTVPSAWLFVAFKLARLARNLGEGRAIKASDYLDADHVGCGPYFDILVTDDSELRATCAMLRERPFRVEGFQDLITRLINNDDEYGGKDT